MVKTSDKLNVGEFWKFQAGTLRTSMWTSSQTFQASEKIALLFSQVYVEVSKSDHSP